uniref:Uncharacterized protein n=1 Tax=Peronospora matthiolae TaxID=2874970 RepID=A0AAV1TAN4_9STRA
MSGRRRWLLLWLLVVVAASERAPRADNGDRLVTITLVDGTTRELTTGEFEELATQRAESQKEQLDKSDGAHWRHAETAHLATLDPSLALHIKLARRAFVVLQRHGYAQGYALSGFSEQETRQAASDYYVELVLEATRDETSGVEAKTGTGTRRDADGGKEETPLRLEVQLLLDGQQRFSVLAAWELSDEEPPRGQQRRSRLMRLSIQPTVAMLEREAARERSKSAVATWLLAGGLGLVAAGVLVMYNTRNPMPTVKPRRRSRDVWELVDENDRPIKMDKRDDKSKRE